MAFLGKLVLFAVFIEMDTFDLAVLRALLDPILSVRVPVMQQLIKHTCMHISNLCQKEKVPSSATQTRMGNGSFCMK